ncbi:tyrosine-type recombinase/integrase [Haploplasma axanthum]|nr:tyrosine-type recombinase/integrase [Haploplasma axanthum]
MKCPITTIQKLLGHSSISITMRYLEIDDYMLEKDYIEHYSYNALKKAD